MNKVEGQKALTYQDCLNRVSPKAQELFAGYQPEYDLSSRPLRAIGERLGSIRLKRRIVIFEPK